MFTNMKEIPVIKTVEVATAPSVIKYMTYTYTPKMQLKYSKFQTIIMNSQYSTLLF